MSTRCRRRMRTGRRRGRSRGLLEVGSRTATIAKAALVPISLLALWTAAHRIAVGTFKVRFGCQLKKQFVKQIGSSDLYHTNTRRIARVWNRRGELSILIEIVPILAAQAMERRCYLCKLLIELRIATTTASELRYKPHVCLLHVFIAACGIMKMRGKCDLMKTHLASSDTPRTPRYFSRVNGDEDMVF